MDPQDVAVQRSLHDLGPRPASRANTVAEADWQYEWTRHLARHFMGLTTTEATLLAQRMEVELIFAELPDNWERMGEMNSAPLRVFVDVEDGHVVRIHAD